MMQHKIDLRFGSVDMSSELQALGSTAQKVTNCLFSRVKETFPGMKNRRAGVSCFNRQTRMGDGALCIITYPNSGVNSFTTDSNA